MPEIITMEEGTEEDNSIDLREFDIPLQYLQHEAQELIGEFKQGRQEHEDPHTHQLSQDERLKRAVDNVTARELRVASIEKKLERLDKTLERVLTLLFILIGALCRKKESATQPSPDMSQATSSTAASAFTAATDSSGLQHQSDSTTLPSSGLQHQSASTVTLPSSGLQHQSASTTTLPSFGLQDQSASTAPPSYGLQHQSESTVTLPSSGLQHQSAFTAPPSSGHQHQSASTVTLLSFGLQHQSASTAPPFSGPQHQSDSTTLPSSDLQNPSASTVPPSPGLQHQSASTVTLLSSGLQHQSTSTAPPSSGLQHQSDSTTLPSSGLQHQSASTVTLPSSGLQHQSASTAPPSCGLQHQSTASVTGTKEVRTTVDNLTQSASSRKRRRNSELSHGKRARSVEHSPELSGATPFNSTRVAASTASLAAIAESPSSGLQRNPAANVIGAKKLPRTVNILNKSVKEPLPTFRLDEKRSKTSSSCKQRHDAKPSHSKHVRSVEPFPKLSLTTPATPSAPTSAPISASPSSALQHQSAKQKVKLKIKKVRSELAPSQLSPRADELRRAVFSGTVEDVQNLLDMDEYMDALRSPEYMDAPRTPEYMDAPRTPE